LGAYPEWKRINILQRGKEGREGGAVVKFPVAFYTRVDMTSFLYILKKRALLS